MGHTPGFPCLHTDSDHDGDCSTAVVGSVVDHSVTRYFEVTESTGAVSHWRTNASAARCNQVEHRRPEGEWRTSIVFDTEHALLKSLAGWEWREITAEEVPANG